MITTKQFFKNFKKHCEIARDLGIYSKRKMIKELNKEKCPFDCYACKEEAKCETFILSFEKCPKLTNLESYIVSADFYYLFNKTELIPKMIEILKSISWRKTNGKP